MFGGSGADTAFGGPGNDRLHALAADGQPDTLDCGAGDDAAVVRLSEQATTTLVGCEHVTYVASGSADEEAEENESGDSQAE